MFHMLNFPIRITGRKIYNQIGSDLQSGKDVCSSEKFHNLFSLSLLLSFEMIAPMGSH